jgi:hypothetical protein
LLILTKDLAFDTGGLEELVCDVLYALIKWGDRTMNDDVKAINEVKSEEVMRINVDDMHGRQRMMIAVTMTLA